MAASDTMATTQSAASAASDEITTWWCRGRACTAICPSWSGYEALTAESRHFDRWFDDAEIARNAYFTVRRQAASLIYIIIQPI